MQNDEPPVLVDLATSPARVSAFCQAALAQLLPNEFFGPGPTGEQNKNLLLKKVHQFVMLRRFEGMSLHEVMQGMKV